MIYRLSTMLLMLLLFISVQAQKDYKWEREALKQINKSNYYTTKGTANETGTGLGLMLCKDFLHRNGGQLFIESEMGKGSTISFTLPTPIMETAAVDPSLN